jgi:hypothetical protein
MKVKITNVALNVSAQGKRSFLNLAEAREFVT